MRCENLEKLEMPFFYKNGVVNGVVDSLEVLEIEWEFTTFLNWQKPIDEQNSHTYNNLNRTRHASHYDADHVGSFF